MTLRRSPLHDEHVALGARMVGFGGWEMPLSYPTGTVAEHLACRRGTVVFDVSHLGTVRVEGAGAFDVLQAQLANDLRKIDPGRAQYSHLLAADGSVVDDLIVWWVGPTRFDVMPNASNTTPVLAAIGGRDVTGERAVLAVQGPSARALLAEVLPGAAGVGRFRTAEVDLDGVPCVVAGTGYTGEDGVECAVPAEHSVRIWRELVRAGAVPAGLGARDTLRLEAGLPLHGHELGPGITPLQAGLGWSVGWEKHAFTGRDALLEERASGVRRSLRGLVGASRRPLRDGAVCGVGGTVVGSVTSGNFSPVLGRGIALAFLSPEVAEGSVVDVELRGATVQASVVAPPFHHLVAGRLPAS